MEIDVTVAFCRFVLLLSAYHYRSPNAYAYKIISQWIYLFLPDHTYHIALLKWKYFGILSEETKIFYFDVFE